MHAYQLFFLVGLLIFCKSSGKRYPSELEMRNMHHAQQEGGPTDHWDDNKKQMLSSLLDSSVQGAKTNLEQDSRLARCMT